ncbi:serine hydrolase [bacterium]|nr:serine hydrolase [bacterium]
MDNKTIQTIIDLLECDYAFYLRRRSSPPLLLTNCERFPSASLIKVPLLLAWVMLERVGEVNSSEICDLDEELQVKGAGFSHLLRGRRLPYQDVLLMMIATSDNLCTNLIIRRMGIERISEVFNQTLGLKGAELQRKLMDFEARERGLDNTITVGDCIRMYDLIHNLRPAERQMVENMLAANQDDGLLLRSIPRDTLTFYHKTGSIPNVLHDWGYTREHEIFFLTQNVKNEPLAFEVFGKLGEILIGK